MQHNAQLHHGVMAALLPTPLEGGGPRRSSPTMVDPRRAAVNNG
jgi:hypothetical protein